MTTDMSDSVNLGAAGELDTICRASPPRQVATCHDMRMGHHGAPWGHLTRSDPCQIAPVQRRTCSSFIPKARPLGDSSAGKPRKACDGPCKTPRSRSTPVTVCHCNFTADNGKVNAEPFCSLHWDGILARRRSKSSKNKTLLELKPQDLGVQNPCRRTSHALEKTGVQRSCHQTLLRDVY